MTRLPESRTPRRATASGLREARSPDDLEPLLRKRRVGDEPRRGGLLASRTAQAQSLLGETRDRRRVEPDRGPVRAGERRAPRERALGLIVDRQGGADPSAAAA